MKAIIKSDGEEVDVRLSHPCEYMAIEPDTAGYAIFRADDLIIDEPVDWSSFPAECLKDALIEWAKFVLKCQEEELAKYDDPCYRKAYIMGKIDAYKVLIAKLNSL